MPDRCGRRQLFVYWRLRRADLDAAVESLKAEHEVLRQRYPGLQAQLLVRGDESGPTSTLMETYALTASVSNAGLDTERMDALEAAVSNVTHRWLLGQRHHEVFDSIEA